MTVVKNEGCNVAGLTSTLQSHVPDAVLARDVGAELTFVHDPKMETKGSSDG